MVALNFVRNYICNDGSVWGPNYDNREPGLKCHESTSDKETRLVKFVREGKMPIVMVNFQTHPLKVAGAQDPFIHADWPGIMRQEVSLQLDVNVIYISGAGGTLDSSSFRGENMSTDWIHHGRRTAEVVVNSKNFYEPATIGKIKAKEITMPYDTDHSIDHLVPIAQPIYDLYSSDFA